MKGIVYYKDKLRKYHSWIILREQNCCCCCCFCIWKRHIKLVHPKLGVIIVWEFNFSKTSKPKSISLSFRCGLRFVKGCRPESTCSEVARYENDISSLLPKCSLINFERAVTHASLWENSGNEVVMLTFVAETSTLAVYFIVSYECLDDKHYESKVYCKLGVSRL